MPRKRSTSSHGRWEMWSQPWHKPDFESNVSKNGRASRDGGLEISSRKSHGFPGSMCWWQETIENRDKRFRPMKAHDNLEEFGDPPNYDIEEGERSAARSEERRVG